MKYSSCNLATLVEVLTIVRLAVVLYQTETQYLQLKTKSSGPLSMLFAFTAAVQ